MNSGNLDKTIDSIRQDAPPAEAIEQAGVRARARLFGGVPASSTSLRTCSDFQALIPAHLNRSLAPAKALLLTDHTHACVGCRRALESERSGNLRVLPRPKTVSTQVSPVTKWAIAALVTVGVGLGSWWTAQRLIAPPGVRASVETVSGTLYQVANATSLPVFSGRELGERQSVRTAKDSTAMLRLADGSKIEMNQRSQLFVSIASRGTTIHLDHGNIIVHAAKQRHGALYVKTADCEVMVKGTIFAVTSGTKGARVSVVEGSVKVDEGGHSVMLKPGDQTTSNASVEKVPVQDEVAWSRDSAQYLAMLGELSDLQKQVEQIPGPGLRTTSKLLALAPANTAIYAAIPNIGSTLAEANRLFQDRMQSSPVLRQWWSEQGKNNTDLQTMVDKIRTASSYLGDEVVLALPATDEGAAGLPVILAEAKAGLKEYLEGEVASANARAGRAEMQIVSRADTLAARTAGKPGPLLLYVTDGVVALSPDSARIQDVAAKIAKTDSSGSFADTELYSRVQQAYQSGASWLFAADLARLNTRGRANAREQRAAVTASGYNDVRFIVVERKEVNGQIKNQATLAFNGHGLSLASWLGAPAPMSTLDFVSPDASVATSFVINNPGALIIQTLQQAEAGNPNLQQQIDAFQNETGVNVVNDLANPLGGELTFAIDGPLVPVPSWKVAVEVYNPSRMEWAFEQLINAVNRQPNAPAHLTLNQTQANGRTYYQLTGMSTQTGAIPAEADWTFVDGYLLAAANRNLLDTAIQNRATGYTLPRSEKFRAQLPQDGNSNFSAIVYHNVAGLVDPLVKQLNSVNAISADQKQAIAALQANSAPGLIYAYGAPNQITIAANGGLFGFNLNTLALPRVIESMMHSHMRSQ